MKKVGLFFVGVCCCVHWLMAKPYVPEAVRLEGQRLYEQLNLEKVVGLQAFQEALSGYYKHRDLQKNILAVIDYSKPSTEKRFCVIDLEHPGVLYTSHVAHGRNSGENYAVAFSNRPGSYQSSLGFFRTGETYYGRNGYSLFLDGLDKGLNDKARERAIVIHGANYADPVVLNGQKRLGRSLGCPALPPAVSGEIIDTIKEGALLYIYGEPSST